VDESIVHTVSAPTTRWSTSNFGEAIQGVQTPLEWTFWHQLIERSARRGFARLGILPRRLTGVPADPDQYLCGIFHGRVAGNVTAWRDIGDAVPGANGDDLVRRMFGETAVASRQPSSWTAAIRYPIILGKSPWAVVCAAVGMNSQRVRYQSWWHRSVFDDPPRGRAEALQHLRLAVERYVEITAQHTIVSLAGQTVAERIDALAVRAWGDASRSADLITGYGDVEEVTLMADLRELARGESTIQEFVRRYGFHGPDEGQLRSRVWREDPTLLERLVDTYRTGSVPDPRGRESERRSLRVATERELLSCLPRPSRAGASLVLRLGRYLVPKREMGKVGFVQSVDVARCAVRVLGRALTNAGLIDDPEDVFFLTYEELGATSAEPLHDLVTLRRLTHSRNESLDLPPAWTGNPQPVERSRRPVPAATRLPVVGIGVSGGRVSGRVCVVDDPSRCELEPGDILVCRTTDPSWTPLFLVAAGVVIETGGTMSHGAIVARELGVPCVISAQGATRLLRHGGRVTVDGGTGSVVRDG
jgi:pyruvate,water dikinase